MREYHDAMKRRHENELTDTAKEAAKSAAIWGGLGSAATQLITGNRSLPNILLRGLGGAAVAAPVAGGATLLGGSILGAPRDDEPAGYSRRGAVGGAVGGSLLGGGLGYLLGSGRLRGLAKLKPVASALEHAKDMLPIDNLVTDQLKKWALKGGHPNGLKGAALLGAGGGLFGGMTGLDEGMGIDTMHAFDQPEDQYVDRRAR